MLIGFAPAFFAAWSVVRLLRISKSFQDLNTSLAASTTQMGQLGARGSAGMAKMSRGMAKAGIVATTFFAAFQVGSIIDDLTGLSDAIAGIEDTTPKTSKFDPEGKASAQGIRAKQSRAAQERLKLALAAIEGKDVGGIPQQAKAQATIVEFGRRAQASGQAVSKANVRKEIEASLRFEQQQEAKAIAKEKAIRAAEVFQQQNPETAAKLATAGDEELKQLLRVMTEELGKNTTQQALANARPPEKKGVIDIKVETEFGMDIDVGARRAS